MDGFLHRVGPAIRMLLTKRVQLKYSPILEFIRTDYARKEEALDVVIERMREQQAIQKTQKQLFDDDVVEEESDDEEIGAAEAEAAPAPAARGKTSKSGARGRSPASAKKLKD